MSKKTMSIPEFLEMVRIKEFNSKRSNKKIYTLAVILILLGISTATVSLIDSTQCMTAFQYDSNQAITAFQLNNIIF